mgnify:FL=1
MPLVKPRELKSELSLSLEPDKMTSRIQLIIALDIAGYNGNQIAEDIGLTPSRISIIRNSPMYKQERDRKWEELQKQVISKKTDKIVAGDPVDIRLKEMALAAVDVYGELIKDGKSEMARKTAADAILDRSGYKPHTEKTVLSVEVTEKMADRFEKVLKRTVITRES